MNVETRLTVLERSVRRWRFATVALAMLVSAGLMIAAQRPGATQVDSLTVKSLTVGSDDTGSILLTAGANDAWLQLKSRDKKSEVRIRAIGEDKVSPALAVVTGEVGDGQGGPVHSSMLETSPDGGRIRATHAGAGTTFEAGRGKPFDLLRASRIEVVDKAGTPGVTLEADDGAGEVHVRAAKSKRSIRLSRHGAIELTNDDGTTQLRMEANEVSLAGSGGRRAVSINAFGSEGRVDLYDIKGNAGTSLRGKRATKTGE